MITLQLTQEELDALLNAAIFTKQDFDTGEPDNPNDPLNTATEKLWAADKAAKEKG